MRENVCRNWRARRSGARARSACRACTITLGRPCPSAVEVPGYVEGSGTSKGLTEAISGRRLGFDVPSAAARELEVKAEGRQHRDGLVELHGLLPGSSA